MRTSRSSHHHIQSDREGGCEDVRENGYACDDLMNVPDLLYGIAREL